MTSIAKIHESIPVTRRGKRAVALTDAQMTAAWLNAATGAAYRRVQALRAHLDHLDELLSGETKTRSPNEWFGHQTVVNEMLARYSFIPYLTCDYAGRRRYSAGTAAQGWPHGRGFRWADQSIGQRIDGSRGPGSLVRGSRVVPRASLRTLRSLACPGPAHGSILLTRLPDGLLHFVCRSTRAEPPGARAAPQTTEFFGIELKKGS